MVDYGKLRKKFPNRNPDKARRAAAIKAIHRDYAAKHAALGGAPTVRRGFVFYAVVIIGLLLLGALVLSATGRGGRARIDRALLDADKSVKALAVALGRYRYHVGSYPAAEEGIAQLASTKVDKPGWNGPYIRKVVRDPWGNDYVYAPPSGSGTPALYSKGPDRIAGTTDDILPPPELFEAPLRDTSWTQGWMPQQLRGYVLVQNEREKQLVKGQVVAAKAANAEQARVVGPLDRTSPEWKRICDAVTAPADRSGAGLAAQANWNEAERVRLLTHWCWEGHDGEKIEVACDSTGDEAELFLNGDSQGRREKPFVWEVPFEAGEIKVISWWNKSPIGEDLRKTAFAAFAINAVAASKELANGETGVVNVELLDRLGTCVPFGEREVTVKLSGPGRIVAIGNGKTSNLELDAAEARLKLDGGHAALAVRRLNGSATPLELHFSATGLRPASVTLPRRN